MENMKQSSMWKEFVENNMEENKAEQKLKAYEAEKNQISTLRSGNSKAILSTLKEIRTTGRITILPEIFELMLITEEKEIISACHVLLSDLKTVDAVPLIISALKEEKFRSIRHLIVSSCWQNGLNYQTDILLFANIVIEDDYLTAIEAFTVIENSIGDLDDKAISKLISRLQTGLASVEEQKKALIKELISAIKNF